MATTAALSSGVTAPTLGKESRRIFVRQASVDDLDALLEIGLAAMPQDPQWDYRFPYRHQFPNDTRLHTRERYREFLENRSGNWFVSLAEHYSNSPYAKPVPVAFAIWNVSNVTNPQAPSHSKAQANVLDISNKNILNQRRDANKAHMMAWKATMKASKANLFDAPYGASHFQLQILATDPAFQRRGAAAALCRDGIQLAHRLGMKITVFASPMGQKLYSTLGFRSVSTIIVRADAEEEFIHVEAMVYSYA